MDEWVAANRLRGVEFRTSAAPTAAPAVASPKIKAKPAKTKNARADAAPYRDTGEVAGIVRRWISAVIDSVIMSLLLFGGAFVGVYLFVAQLDPLIGIVDDPNLDLIKASKEMQTYIANNLDALMTPLAAVFGLMVLLPFIYEVFFEASPAKGTIGKMICKIEVATTRGEGPGFFRIFLRTILKFVFTYMLFFGCLTILVTKKRQALHDLVCGTVVVVK